MKPSVGIDGKDSPTGWPIRYVGALELNSKSHLRLGLVERCGCSENAMIAAKVIKNPPSSNSSEFGTTVVLERRRLAIRRRNRHRQGRMSEDAKSPSARHCQYRPIAIFGSFGLNSKCKQNAEYVKAAIFHFANHGRLPNIRPQECSRSTLSIVRRQPLRR
jgi:hypothetical protein